MSMNTSIKSTALEPGRSVGFGRRFLTIYGMVILAVALVAIFAVAKPDTFPTLLNFQLLASAKAPLMIIALAVTIPMVTGKIDLSAGYAAGLWQVMALSWQINGMDYRLVILLCLVGGALIGLFNALLVELAQVDAFIATLATGQVIFAITMWYTGGQQVTDADGARAISFDSLATWTLGPVPGPFIVAVLLAAIMWAVLEFLPVGRYLYAVGANPAAARLTGIPRRICVAMVMTSSGVLAAFAGILLAARQAGIAQANVGPDFLMPALSAAFLGSTTIKPGRVNALGTVLGVFITTVGISGLQQLLPGRYFLEPLFNGLTLIAAITIASMASRQRLARADSKFTQSSDATPAAPPGTTTPPGDETPVLDPQSQTKGDNDVRP